MNTPAKGNWFQINGQAGHVGAGRARPVLLYLFAENIVHALNKYKGISRIKSTLTPDVKMLTESEGKKLEQKITCERRVDLGRAKRSYYLSL